MADQLFDQADTNKDQRLDINEFRNLIAQNLGPGASIYTGNIGSSGSGYETTASASFAEAGANHDAFNGIGNFIGADAIGGQTNYSSYERASYGAGPGMAVNSFQTRATPVAELNRLQAPGSASSSSFEAATVQQQVQQYPTNAQGLFQDPNPQIVRRPAPDGQLTYTQNIKIRFLQPPAVPPPGPLIIKEVRPPQPPPPPPLVVRQRAPPLAQQPPLILRERPPPPPASIGAETVIRKLPPVPVPPRSVIIERLPPLPPKPRDIIIERWLPYNFTNKRKTIVQRAEPAKEYPKPRNVIIQYEAPQVRVVRQFQRLGVTPENPQAYVQRYGPTLFDTQALVQQARAAGVVEDISAPMNLVSSSPSSGVEVNATRSSSSPYNATNSVEQQQPEADFAGFETIQSGGNNGAEFTSFYQSNAFASQSPSTAHHATTSGYETYPGSMGNNISFVEAAFNAADLNKDGSIDSNEFRQFLNAQLQ